MVINGSEVIAASRKQDNIALSTCEAEYMAALKVTKELKWLVQFLGEICIAHERPELFIDNQSTIAFIKNTDTKRRSKHTELRLHHIREDYVNLYK